MQPVVQARWLLSYQAMRKPLYNAWDKVDKDYRSQKDDIRRIIDRNSDYLEEHGLTGDQWKAKFSGFRHAYNHLWARGGLRALKRVLKWINNLLSSMKDALSTIFGLGFLKEMKDLVEAVMDDTLEPAGHWM